MNNHLRRYFALVWIWSCATIQFVGDCIPIVYRSQKHPCQIGILNHVPSELPDFIYFERVINRFVWIQVLLEKLPNQHTFPCSVYSQLGTSVSTPKMVASWAMTNVVIGSWQAKSFLNKVKCIQDFERSEFEHKSTDLCSSWDAFLFWRSFVKQNLFSGHLLLSRHQPHVYKADMIGKELSFDKQFPYWRIEQKCFAKLSPNLQRWMHCQTLQFSLLG